MAVLLLLPLTTASHFPVLSNDILRGFAPPELVMLIRVKAVLAVGGLIRNTAMDPVANSEASRFDASKYRPFGEIKALLQSKRSSLRAPSESTRRILAKPVIRYLGCSA